jgi:7-cyano-7-deazaguanine synthase
LSKKFCPHALIFRYGQRHKVQLASASRVAEALGVAQHIVLDINLRQFGGSALTAALEVPKGRSVEAMSARIPLTYVPARNAVFLSFALACAEVLGSTDIFIGVNAVDYSGYPDCRPEFIEAFQRTASLATRMGVEGGGNLTIHTPLIHLTKAEIIRAGLALGVDYSLTLTCYDPSTAGDACGACDACLLRRKGFEENGLVDPARYVLEPAVVV